LIIANRKLVKVAPLRRKRATCNSLWS